MDFADTIVAPITPPGRGAVAVIRLSGPEAHSIAANLMPSMGGVFRYAYYGEIHSSAGPMDDGIAILFEENASYTGEAVAEISCHGSPEIVREIIAETVSLGARIARPGEFTERAFLNGTMDLSQAESVREAVDSATEAQARRATLLRSGALFEKVSEIEMDLGRAIASIEAVVDFSEEVGDLDRVTVLSDLASADSKVGALLEGVRPSRLLREGLRIAIAGRPNVGKSSLLNALLGVDRAIVTDIPGTTRDTIEELVSVRGYPVVITDTAGLRTTEDPVEAMGVSRSREAIRQADSVWLVFESQKGVTQDDQAVADQLGREFTWVANKCDLGAYAGNAIQASATSEGGIENLIQWIVAQFESTPELPLANERHSPDLEATREAIARACETLTNVSVPVDLACVDLYDGLTRLGRITGRTAPDEVIRRVFADFCIGK